MCVIAKERNDKRRKIKEALYINKDTDCINNTSVNVEEKIEIVLIEQMMNYDRITKDSLRD